MRQLKSISRVEQLGNIYVVNFLKNENTILHFSKPEVQAAIGSNKFAIFGNPKTKKFSELMPEILNHIGPKQMSLLQELMKETYKKNVDKIAEADQKEENDIPNLVEGQNFKEASKKEQPLNYKRGFFFQQIRQFRLIMEVCKSNINQLNPFNHKKLIKFKRQIQ
ncbi:unnamed protein product [Paramecium pentaurelia]|uniref:Nascent polypeptide-associated complex subunit beta n=1 Tax=Paramecium pentaurelia TaxID=43138 RepID=A0A8S1UFR9_9CILI|nr:unnamed protein product [Paramecium pentaurelia]